MKIEISEFEGVVDTGAIAKVASDSFPPRTVKMLRVKVGEDIKALIDLDAFVLPDYKLPAATVYMEKGQTLTFETK